MIHNSYTYLKPHWMTLNKAFPRLWHHWLNGHESEQVLGVGDGQGSLVCCSPGGRKELDISEQLNWEYGTHTTNSTQDDLGNVFSGVIRDTDGEINLLHQNGARLKLQRPKFHCIYMVTFYSWQMILVFCLWQWYLFLFWVNTLKEKYVDLKYYVHNCTSGVWGGKNYVSLMQMTDGKS